MATEKQKKTGLSTITLIAKIIIVAVKAMIATAVAEIKTAFGSALEYKGTVDTFDALPKEGQNKGDVYNVKAEFTIGTESFPKGTNVAWDGEAWDPLGGDMSGFLTPNDFEEFSESEVQQAVQSGIQAAQSED